MSTGRADLYDSDVVGESASGVARSTATVLFTDLVGSTAMRSRLGEDAAEALRRTHDRLIVGVVEANRGRVVKYLGDGVMATFSGAVDAVNAAVQIQQAIDRQSRAGDSDVPLEVRIGVSAGDVAFEEADCFGTPVIEAARLCAAAEGRKILVTDVVRLLAGPAAGREFAPVGALDLKGLPAPVPACDVAWHPLVEPAFPMPVLLTGVGRIFVGRAEELERLLRLWKEAAAGERRTALLAGEPGIGKTRLAVELAGAVRESGGVVLAGRCDDGLGVPYQPFVEALRHYLSGAADRRLGRYAGELTRLLPDLPEFVDGLAEPLRSDPETERYRLFDALAGWLADASAEAPVLLVLDDLHWATEPTLLLLRHVLRSAEPMRLLIVVTYRDSDIGRGHPMSDLLADLRRHGGVERLTLSGLDASAVAAFIESAAGHRLEDAGTQELPDVVWRETEGNPFFVAEVIRHLAESRAVEQRDGRWVLRADIGALGIPEGVREVIGRRLSRLTESTNRVLATAAVVGLEFEPAVVGRLGFSEDELLAALQEAVNARLLVEVPATRYRFGHALVRATLYEELTGARRATLHRRVAEAIESLHGGALGDDYLPALAHHFAGAGDLGDVEKAVRYNRQAGDRAQAQFANAEAATYYAQALRLLPDGPDAAERMELMISLGEAQRRAGEPAHRETLLGAARLARREGNVDGLARAALANSRRHVASVMGAVDVERVDVLELALGGIGAQDSATRAQLLAILAVELVYSGDEQRCRRLSDEALTVARRVGDPETLAQVLVSRFMAIWVPESRDERLANTAELLAVSSRLADPAVASRAWALRYRAAMEVGDIDEADRCLEPAARLAAEAAQPAVRWFEAVNRAGRLHIAGRLGEAERMAVEARELGEAGAQPEAGAAMVALLIQLRRDQGRLEELEAQLKETSEQFPGIGYLDSSLALLYCETGRPADAREVFARYLRRGFARRPRNHIWLMGACYGAMVCAHLDDPIRAAELHDVLASFPDQVAGAGGTTVGSLQFYVGLVARTMGNLDEAAECFGAAASVHERMGAPAMLARAELELAGVLTSRGMPGDRERADELRQTAAGRFRRAGMDSWSDHAAGLVAPDGPPRMRLPGGLSEREADVLRLVASGGSNKAIAADLGLSVKTVERHIANIFVKLGVSSRTAATSFAHREGIV